MTRDTPVPYAAGSPTSKAAAESAEPNASTIRERIYVLLLDAYAMTPRCGAPQGLTADEIETLMGIRPNVASARLWELRKAGRIVDSGSFRMTRRRRLATVWRVRLAHERPDDLAASSLERRRDAAKQVDYVLSLIASGGLTGQASEVAANALRGALRLLA